MLLRSIKENKNVKLIMTLAIAFGLILGAATVYATPEVVAAIFLVIFMAYLILKRPEIALLGLIVFTSTFLEWDANPAISIGFGTIYLTDILLFLSLLMIIIRALVERDFKIVHTPLDLPIILFVGFAFLSTFLAIMQTPLKITDSLHEMRTVAHYLLFFAATNLIRNDSQLRTLLRGLTILAMVVAIGTLIQYILGTTIDFIPGRVEELYTEGVTYSSVTRIIPPGYSLMFVVFITLSAVLLFGKLQAKNWFLLLPWILTGMGVVISFKRHLWAGVFLAFFLIMYLGRSRQIQRLIGGSIAIISVSFIGVIYLLNFTGNVGPDLIESSIDRVYSFIQPSTYTDPESSLRWRDFEYQYAFPKIRENPVFGLGLGAQYRPWIQGQDWEKFDGRWYIHNGHVWVMMKAGLLSYIPLFYLMALFLYRGFKYWRFIPEVWKRGYYLGFTLAFLGMVVGALIEPLVIGFHWTPIVGVMLGVNELILKSVTQIAID